MTSFLRCVFSIGFVLSLSLVLTSSAPAAPAAAKAQQAKKALPEPLPRDPNLANSDAKGISKAELQALAKQIEAAGQGWAEGKAEDPEVLKALKAVRYDAESVPALDAELRGSKRKDPVDLYVASKLLEPLVNSKPAVIKSALPAAKAVYARNSFYLQPPQFTPEQLKMLSGEGASSASPEQMLKDVQRMKEMQEMRQNKERPAIQHNQTIFAFEKLLYTLMLIADDRNEDATIMNQLAGGARSFPSVGSSSKATPSLEASKACLSFRAAYEALNSETKNLSEAHAKYLYESLLRLADQARMTRNEYQELNAPTGGGAKNITFRAIKLYPGQNVAELVNQLASIAKKPAVNVILPAEVDAYLAKKGRKK